MAAGDELHDVVTRALAAQYDVLRLLGRGGMGAVFLARERLLERLVAVKVLPTESAGESNSRERFLREARTAARLTHPSIVPLHSFIEAEGTLLYVMGYIDGESLESLLQRESRIAPERVRSIIGDIADALGYAHQMGVVHRDVKPDNVLIERETGRAYLADFGIAKHAAADTLTRTGMLVGTPQYMSPEQASGDPALDGRSDLYALGVIAYRMSSGRLPFDGASVQEMLSQRFTRDPLPLSSIVPEMPDDLATVVMRCLRRDPAERWPDGATLKASLDGDDTKINVPEGLESLVSIGPRLMLIALGFWVISGIGFAWDGDTTWLALGGVLPALVPLIPAWMLADAKRSGIGFRRGMKLAFLAPSDWRGWWPRALRRPGDVWDRLPTGVRAARMTVLINLAIIWLAALPGAVISIIWRLSGRTGAVAERLSDLVPTLFWIPGVLILAPLALSVHWARKFKLPQVVAVKLLNEPLVGRFWRRAEVAPLLGESASKPSLSATSPREIARALREHVTAAPPHLREAVGDAARVAADVANVIDALDGELGELIRELDPAERRRLEQKLGSTAGAQMRDLVHGQMRLLDELERRRAMLADRRDRYTHQLRGLWLRVQQLRGLAKDAVANDSGISEEIRALRQHLDAELLGANEVHRLLTHPLSSEDPLR